MEAKSILISIDIFRATVWAEMNYLHTAFLIIHNLTIDNEISFILF